MSGSPQKFANLLTEAIHTIRLRESKRVKKTIRIVQDELGYALGREGGSAIEYWRKGHIPAAVEDIAALARETRRAGTPLLLAADSVAMAEQAVADGLVARTAPDAVRQERDEQTPQG